ncbi:hypothetical protein [Actinomadura algeriensis]|uniref:Uncharacterized protein n=1 Tax=Actinomadura algeriensis TaxID=1679523 RepID=A0ABR9JJW4_9ACTN|nr:hypothetical protein [Actinomadura algeriensis]MBE1530858.1 hypothetical protein [Actinomadura algeriensis]
MSDQADSERKRRERASLARAFDRRAWQRGEKPKVPTRLLAGGIALVVAGAVVFGIGALISFQQDKEDRERKAKAALTRPTTPPPATPSPSPSAKKKTPDAPVQKKPAGAGDGPATEPLATPRKRRSPSPEPTAAERRAAVTAAKPQCPGGLIDRKVAHYQGEPIAELVVYDNGGETCAALNHLGVTRGMKLRTSVFLVACTQTSPSSGCGFHGSAATMDAEFTRTAGPVTKFTGTRCLHAAGDIYFHGRHHLQVSPIATHCG